MVSSSLHITRTFFPSRTFSMTSIIAADDEVSGERGGGFSGGVRVSDSAQSILEPSSCRRFEKTHGNSSSSLDERPGVRFPAFCSSCVRFLRFVARHTSSSLKSIIESMAFMLLF